MAKLIRKRARQRKTPKERLLSYRNCAIGQIVLVPAAEGTEKWLLEVVGTSNEPRMGTTWYCLEYKILSQAPGQSNHIGFIGNANGSINIDGDPFGGQGARIISKKETEEQLKAWNPMLTFTYKIDNPFVMRRNA